MADCLFCKIINGEIPSTKVYEDGEVLAFKDINPQMPVHVLVIPKTHIDSLAALDESTAPLAAKCLLTAKRIAEESNLSNGYRVVTNIGDDGGQTVHHLHFHLLGGSKMTEKMS